MDTGQFNTDALSHGLFAHVHLLFLPRGRQDREERRDDEQQDESNNQVGHCFYVRGYHGPEYNGTRDLDKNQPLRCATEVVFRNYSSKLLIPVQ